MKNSLISSALRDLLQEIANTSVDFVEYDMPCPPMAKSGCLTMGAKTVETKTVAVQTKCALLGKKALSELKRMESLCREAATFIDKNMWRPIEDLGMIEIPDSLRILGKTKTGSIYIYYWDSQKYHKNPKPFWRNTTLGTIWSRENPPVFFKALDDEDPSDALKNLVLWGI